MKSINKLADYNNPKSLANRFRNARFNFFEEKLKQTGLTIIKILDVGGTESFWVNRGYHLKDNVEITLLNLYKEDTSHQNIIGVIGDATDLSGYEDHSFDIVFSNSVIEHLFDYEHQILMAKEVQRVGRYHFIQTPNKYFFVEPHFLLPFFQFYPKGLQKMILTKTRLSRGKKYTQEGAKNILDEIKLLSMKQLKSLFLNSKIYKEIFLGMTKSLTAHNF